MSTTFGHWIREKRLSKDLTLREFAKLINIDASTWSKIERGYAKFPTIAYNIPKIELVFDLKNELELNNEEFNIMDRLIRLHNIEYNTIFPPDITKLLPSFFFASFNDSLSDKKINLLIETIKKLYENE